MCVWCGGGRGRGRGRARGRGRGEGGARERWMRDTILNGSKLKRHVYLSINKKN